jgi:hypothetical protein
VARNINGSGAPQKYLLRAQAIVTAVPISYSAWAKPTSLASGSYQSIFLIDNSSDSYIAMYLHPSNSKIAAYYNAAGSFGEALSANALTAGWNHCGAVFTSGASRTAYSNGVAGTLNAANISAPAGLNETQSGTVFGVNAYNGPLAEVGVWNVALDAGEMLALGKGFTPTLIRPQSLIAYYPLFGYASPETDAWKNGFHLVLSATPPPQADHPPMIYAA